jgi:uncharacterized protein (UPF0261 family)/energy-coupling factor transporter ATP-binding protein EcfA2
MDEPTEGLAPVIVAQVEEMLIRLGEAGDVDVLVIEQNIGVACAVAESVAIMLNGRIERLVPARELAADRNLQQALLGVGRHAHDETPEPETTARGGGSQAGERDGVKLERIWQANPKPPTRWSQPVSYAVHERLARAVTTASATSGVAQEQAEIRPLALAGSEVVLVVGTLDTNGEELRHMRDLVRASGLPARLVDLSTSGKHTGADIPAHQVAAFHPRGAAGVFTGDRGQSVAGMTLAFERWIARQQGIAGVLAAGGSGGTAIVAPAMRSLPIGLPKLIVSTVASGEVSRYVGASDIMMMHSVADVQGLNAITRAVLGNAAQAMAGMVQARKTAPPATAERPVAVLSMFGVTTTAVQQVQALLPEPWDSLVFHMTGIGGQAMEKLIESGQARGVLDLTTTELCDHLFGGIFPCTEDRLGAVIRTRIPYIGSVGALDMVNFGAPATVPERYRGRTFYEHNPHVTLMRTTAAENAEMGRWLGERLNRMDGQVRFFLPEGGVSALDAPGKPFEDSAARRALFEALEGTVRQNATRQLVRVPHNINDRAFAAQVVTTFRDLHGERPARRQAQKRETA